MLWIWVKWEIGERVCMVKFLFLGVGNWLVMMDCVNFVVCRGWDIFCCFDYGWGYYVISFLFVVFVFSFVF